VDLAIPAPSNDDAERLTRVVDALLAGDEAAAEAELAPIAGLTHEQQPAEKLPTLPRSGWTAGTGALTRNPPLRTIAVIYARDSFTCVYCLRQTVVLGVLRLLSSQFPEALPFQANWKKSETHRAYWDISTSLDHVNAVSRGGAWEAVENLATACYRCQHQKSNHSLDVLGWERRFQPSDWDGLTRRYRPLWTLLGEPRGSHRDWIKSFEQAGSRAS
jgi:hypothetical protein